MVQASFRSIRHKIGSWRACCELAMGRDRNRANLVDGGMVRHWVRMPGCCLPSSGDRSGAAQGIDLVDGCVCGHLRGDRRFCGNFRACSGAAFVRWFVRSFVLVVVGWLVGWWMRRYALPIWCDDMHCRYALPIWCDDMQGLKTEKAKSNMLLAPDVVCFCDSLLLFSYPLKYFSHISGNNPSNKILELH